MQSSLTASDRKKIKTAELISYIIAGILGVLFHFVYDWTSENRLIGFFVPVNESTWEHLKLIFYPVALVSVLEYYLTRIRFENFLCIKVRSIWVGMLYVITLFYTYSGILGKTVDWFNIVVYFLSLGGAYCYSCRRLLGQKPVKNTPALCIISFTTIAILFMVFTLYPPAIGLFAEP